MHFSQEYSKFPLEATTQVDMSAEYIHDGSNQVKKIINLSESKASKLWRNVMIHPEFQHDFASISSYFIKHGKRKADMEKLKKHLLFIGWTIEFKDDDVMRFRYLSPDGILYYSLYQVCSYLTETDHEDIISEIDTENFSTDISVPSSTIDSECFMDLDILLDCKAIIEYVEHMDGKGKKDKTLIENAKECLERCGWNLYMKQKKNKQELVYCSPNGKNYFSLYTACKSFFEEQHLNTTITSKKTMTKSQINETSFEIKKNIGSKTKSSKRKRKGRKDKGSPIEVSTDQHDCRNILSWLLKKKVILLMQKVDYMREKDGLVMKSGKVTPDGIKCMCCGMLFSLAKFQAHAGNDTSLPASRMYFCDGKSLLQHQIEAINFDRSNHMSHIRLKMDYSNYEADFVCSICCDGGDILLCDHCPSAFHLECIGLKEIPKGSWYCPSCKCHLCGKSDTSYDVKESWEKVILYCDQCERGYHVGCFSESEPSMPESSTGSWFCSKDCSKINNYLEKKLGKQNHTSKNDITWTILRSNRGDEDNFDVETIAEYHSKLNVAVEVLHQCFETIIEPRTQSDVVSDMLFNRASELRRLNFWGVYTVILEKGGEIISVATLRILGKHVAEMPLIGTRFIHRGKGLCRLLVTEIEKMLTEIGVEKFALPAAPSLLKTWTDSFKFIQMNTSDRMNLFRFSLLNFPDAIMCCKNLNGVTSPSHVSKGKDEHGQSLTNCCTSESDDEMLTSSDYKAMDCQLYPRKLKMVSRNAGRCILREPSLNRSMTGKHGFHFIS